MTGSRLVSDEHRSQAEILAAIAQAQEELTASLADLKVSVEELTSRPLLTEEEKRELEEQAESGALGEDMATLVGKIKDGEDTWERVFSGESPNGALLQSHLTRMVEEHQEDIALAFEELIEEEEAKGNFIFDEVPLSTEPGT